MGRCAAITLFELCNDLTFVVILVVTGATDGIGKEFALQLAKAGFNILLASRTESKLRDVAAEIGK